MREALREKAVLFYASKLRTGGFIRVSMQTLRGQIAAVENELLAKIESTYKDNVFSMAFADVESSSAPQTNFW